MKQFTSFRFVWYKQQLLCNGLTACLCLLLFFPLCLFSQAPTIQWNKTIGGNSSDEVKAIQKTSDGGYILGGTSFSSASGDKTENNKGLWDYWVVKLDHTGTMLWDKTIGGNFHDFLNAIQQTPDGGYILGGTSFSPASGDKTENSRGSWDYWVVKLDPTGTKLWDKTIGGNDWDELKAIQQTSDGGYILGGFSISPASGDKTEENKGSKDYWVVKLDPAGTKLWDKTIGGNDEDELKAIQQTSDDGYILGGFSISPATGDKTENSKGGNDYWIVKLDPTGTKVWDKTIGGNSNDELNALLQQTSDGGYILGGTSFSPVSGDKTENSKGENDYWVIKLGPTGTKLWDKTIGGNFYDILIAIQETSDGGYILGGYSSSTSSGDKMEDSKGENDYWVVKLDPTGTKLWDKTIGGNNTDLLSALQQSSEGGYILAGSSNSDISGDKTENSKGDNDYWVVKLDAESTPTLTINCTPYVNLCYNASQTYSIPPLEISGDLGIESISYTVYPFPGLIGPCPDNPEVYCLEILRSGEGVNASGSFPQQVSSFGTQTSYDIVWNVLDVNGNSHYCQTRVTINPEITISIPDVYAINPGGNVNTVYIGYQPASSITLTASPSGGIAPYGYNWSTSPSQTTQQITVSPTTTSAYTCTVNDATGCTASSTKTITVVDIRTPGKPGKVNICHRDLKGKWITLSVLASSVAEHSAHGDYLGICNNNSSNTELITRTANETGNREIISEGFKIYPNPATNFLDVHWATTNKSQSTIRILNAEGRVVRTLTTKGGVNNQRISLNGLAKGIYMLILKTGSDQQVSKFVIQ